MLEEKQQQWMLSAMCYAQCCVQLQPQCVLAGSCCSACERPLLLLLPPPPQRCRLSAATILAAIRHHNQVILGLMGVQNVHRKRFASWDRCWQEP
jgi:hypothetical protein